MAAAIDATVRASSRRSRVVVLQNPFRGDRLRQAVHETLDKQINKDGLNFVTRSFVSLLRRFSQKSHAEEEDLNEILKRR